MANPELDRLLINNLGDLEAATRHLFNVLQPEVARVLNEKLEADLSRSGWIGRADYEADDEFWMAPPEWRRSTDPTDLDFECWFSMDSSDGEWDRSGLWLTHFVGTTSRLSGMRWSRDVRNKRLWRKQLIEQPDIVARLRLRGFEFHEANSTFFMPVKIEKEKLANAFAEESPEMAFEPFDAVVQACINAKADFDELIAACPIDGGRTG